MKTKYLIPFFILCFCTTIKSQIPTWQWAKNNKSLSTQLGLHEYGNAIATDSKGNCYVIGEFQQNIILGDDTLLSSGVNSVQSMFVVKYDSLGNKLWSYTPTNSPPRIKGFDIVLDSNDNCYLTGIFMQGNATFGTTTLTQLYGVSFFVIKLDTQGNVLWAKAGNTTAVNSISYSNTEGLGMDIDDNNGYLYITGSFQDSISFDHMHLTESSGQYGLFIAKYDLNGSIIWAKKITGGGWLDFASNDISVGSTGGFCITGSFSVPMTIENTLINNSTGVSSVFTAKFNSSGNLIWCKTSVGSISTGSGNAIDIDAFGNTYVAGRYNANPITFDNSTTSGTSSFIVAYDTNGNVLWLRSILGSNADVKTYNNAVYISIEGGINICKYDASGTPIWSVSALGSAGNNFGNSLTVNAQETIYVTGKYSSSTCLFGNNIVLFNNDIWTGSYDFFIAKLGRSNPNGIFENLPINLDFNIYPNPVSETLTIHFPSYNPSTIINIYNLLGELQPVLLTNENSRIDVSSYCKGIYIVEIIDGTSIGRQKFVKY